MKILVFFALAAFFVYSFLDTIAKGKFSKRYSGNYWRPASQKVISKEKNPLRFWSGALFNLFAAGVLVLLALYEMGAFR
jgi:hypothetical protein